MESLFFVLAVIVFFLAGDCVLCLYGVWFCTCMDCVLCLLGVGIMQTSCLIEC